MKKLLVTFKFPELIQPIRLQPSAHKNRDYNGIRLQASGWGLNWTNGKEINLSPVDHTQRAWNKLISKAFLDLRIYFTF